MMQPVRTIEAQFEDGLLKPMQPLPLRPGERVNIIVLRKADPNRWDLNKLAAMPREDIELAETGLDQWAERLHLEDTVETR